jgi:hypothetical protein
MHLKSMRLGPRTQPRYLWPRFLTVSTRAVAGNQGRTVAEDGAPGGLDIRLWQIRLSGEASCAHGVEQSIR